MKNPVTLVSRSTIAALALSLGITTQAQAQIVPTPTGDPGATGTIVTPTNTQIDITGGVTAGNLLFHSFSQFDVNQGQTANFQVFPYTDNVLTRVTNNNPSKINGTLQLSGANANLFLMNPAGIIFGPNVNLNLPASFIGTTANALSYRGYISEMISSNMSLYSERELNFNASGENLYGDRNRHDFPLGVSFFGGNGTITNFGELSVPNDLIFLASAIVSRKDISGRNVSLVATSMPSEWSIQASFDKYSGSAPNIVYRALAANLSSINPNQPETIQSFNLDGSRLVLKAGDIITTNILGTDKVEIYGHQVQVGNIQASSIPIHATKNTVAGNLTSSINSSTSTLSMLSWGPGVFLNSPDTEVSSITAPTPTPSLTSIAPSPTKEEPIANFDRTSVLNGTIDPTDTINLSAGAIRGAAINPGGLLKVELDTRNPEGVLTRKVTK